MSANEVPASIFRAYDIRGVVGTTLSADIAHWIGRAVASEARDRGVTTLVIGRDGRHSSPDLATALASGMNASGCDVIDIGQAPTPVMYFATHELQTGSGVAITGSHNPPDYNGMKVMIAGDTLSGVAVTALYERIRDGRLHEGEGRTELRTDIVERYIERICSDIRPQRRLKIVLDAGNGVAGAIAPRLFQELGCEVEALFCEVDGDFPNHHPDPAEPHNLETLIERVVASGADLGLAFDGDGDRLGVIDSTGKIIWPDRQLMLYAQDVLSRRPGEAVVFDVKCSIHLARVIEAAGGIPQMSRTGHSLIKATLRASGAPLAGEMSGHTFFVERWYGFDDGLYTAARLIEIVAADGRSSAEIFAELPEGVSTPELKVEVQEGEQTELISALVSEGQRRFTDATLHTIDGIRVEWPDGWGLVRASNTTPVLVVRFEADDEAALARIRSEFEALFGAVRPGLTIPA
ncbi:phosphomannomutase/phosphoglucomutase [Halorhodospira abdelmalekii]|uniref:phosphomannomutase/phosphoglucomutase n=1 Tax=Halorhodospira abdelmalekii TaxID=421629 RepID=UPI0019080E5B|nr:phosphomannomutase/phosphoglucomutase [Halorhodospira abdelmalekii]